MKRYAIYLLLLFCGIYVSASAQTFQSKIKMLTEKSDVILTGKVVKQKSNWNHSKTKIYTNVTIEVNEVIKGSAVDKNIEVKHLGGEVGDVGEWYSHIAQFKPDEEVLLFAKKEKNDKSYILSNGEDGKITLFNDKKTGEKITSSNIKISTLKKEIKNYVKKQ